MVIRAPLSEDRESFSLNDCSQCSDVIGTGILHMYMFATLLLASKLVFRHFGKAGYKREISR